ncbi:hypothetical protein QKW60_05505 [Defluviimonas aestuarii]|uniref:hypothetical protein n=1 Tax=Albidovulum aestuarii TaxID=1130726 RepID=UPI00249B3968|nr:hypothetical protein [Defluviimonas aestuarii]MDI3335852.1 hypothetical protein [Defluviimonas aestuarii]
MTHTKAAIRRHRSLYVILLALCVAYWAEPGVGLMTDACRDLIHFFTERSVP